MVKGKTSLREDDGGQAVVEYILILSVIASFYVVIAQWTSRVGIARLLSKPITVSFANAYQFGDVKAAGPDSGTPKRHARIQGCEECFRLFINPKVK